MANMNFLCNSAIMFLMRSLIPPVLCSVDSDEIQELCGVRTEVAADSNSAPDH